MPTQYYQFSNVPFAWIIFLVTLFCSYYLLNPEHRLLNRWAQHSSPILRAIAGYVYYLMPKSLESWLLDPQAIFERRQYYRIFTHGLIHANYIHLFMNMIVYWYFVFPLELVVGHWRMLMIYLGTLLLGGVVSAWRKRGDESYKSLGASGALSGVVFAFILYFPDAVFLVFFIIPMKAWLAGLLFMVISYYAARGKLSLRKSLEKAAQFFYRRGMLAQAQFIASLYNRPQGSSLNIDHEAHMWGALFGMVLTILTYPAVLIRFVERWLG